ncbi:hypothetical protein PENSPDRAFT_759342 [Peniophora sp. CONT]|nr:hypothetical protein PENSPDRAFT_759342 [Peniophora sp. CONT]
MTTAAPSQGRTTTTSRRFSQVYVDIPPSPYRRDSLKAATVKTPSDENMPEDNGDVHASSKRKRDGGDNGDVKEKKKVKTDKGGVKGKAASAEKSSLEEQYPHGYFHCHQCVQKRDARDGLQCTFRGHGGTQGRRCKLKYCKTCLKNRYGLDIDVLRQRHPNSLHGKELVEYVTDVDHVFKCPRCTKMCNCRTCRKAQGLPPTGNLTVTAKRTGADSVAAMLATNKNLTEAQAKQMDLPAPTPPAPKASSSKTATKETDSKPKRAYNRKPKPVPQPMWSPAPVPGSFTLEHGLSRVHIHDFVLRFSSFFGDLTRVQLDELSEIGGRGVGGVDEDADEEDEVDVGVKLGWISEGCLRGILLGLLGLAVDSEEVEDDKETLRAFKAASLGVRNAGASLNKMYTALTSSNLSDLLDLPEPLQPPSTRGRVTRSETRTVGEVHIVTSAQLLPVVERLVEVAVASVGVKEVMDETGTKLADFAREERERRKEEKERWEVWRKANTVTKTERDAHTATLSSFTHALSIAQSSHAPRFAPLGTDNAGRVFVVAAPTVTERDVASELLTGEKNKKGGRGRAARIVPSEDERASMKKWGWFLAVYGEIPDGAMRVRDGDESDDDEEEEGKRWWGFYEPGEIRKVAGWIAHTNGLVEEKDKDKEQAKRASPWDSTVAKAKSTSAASSSRAASSPLSSAPQSSSASRSARESLTPLSSLESDEDEDGQPSRRTATRAELEKLVQSLKDYADLLEWRVSRHDGDGQAGGGEKDAGKGKGKSGVVQPKSFYG